MVVASCGPPPAAKPTAPEVVSIVASERGPHGVRLVAIDERGDRRFELVIPAPLTATSVTRDSNPAVSPDARWLVFASNRDRSVDGTSLWIAPLAVDAVPRRLTQGTAIDAHPTWSPDGRSIVFASTRADREFDLWRLAIDPAGAPGTLTQLTDAPGHEVTPTVAPDGTIAYASVTPTGAGSHEIDSHLEERAPDGTIRKLTEGPGDTSPAFSPDGATIAFARPVVHNGAPDAELWRMDRGSGAVAQLVELPLTDESGPVWSRDGRFVFATSVLRGAGGNALFSSVVHVDLREHPARARLLGDHAGPVARLTPAVPARRLDVAALRSDPEYLPELARIMADKIVEQTHR
jgi:Tol biopolymer transport system component